MANEMKAHKGKNEAQCVTVEVFISTGDKEKGTYLEDTFEMDVPLTFEDAVLFYGGEEAVMDILLESQTVKESGPKRDALKRKGATGTESKVRDRKNASLAALKAARRAARK